MEKLYCYCISCYSGNEEKVAEKIRRIADDVTAIVPVYEREEKKNGAWSRHCYALLPGYLFIYTDNPLKMSALFGISQLTGILRYDDDSCELKGNDLEFAQWVWRYHGTIGLSRVVMEGDRIKVIDGPLKDYEGVIKKVNKHRRSAMVEIKVGKHSKDVWMSFQWFDASQEVQTII